MKPEACSVKLADIIVSDELQNRAGGVDPRQVQNIREAIQQKAQIDRIKIFHCRTEGKEGLYLFGGFTRREAYLAEGKVMAPAYRYSGTWEQLVMLAAKENNDKLHKSMPLHFGDRKRAAQMVLRIHPDWSDMAVAKELGIGRVTVQGARAEMPDEYKPKTRTRADGTTRKIPDRSAVKPKEEASADLDASWRQMPLTEFLKVDSGDFWRDLDHLEIETAGQLWDALTDDGDTRLKKVSPAVKVNLKGQIEAISGGEDLPKPKPPKTGMAKSWDWNRDFTAYLGPMVRGILDQLPANRPEVKHLPAYKGICRRIEELHQDIKNLKKQLGDKE